jgi:hypothetical protein
MQGVVRASIGRVRDAAFDRNEWAGAGQFFM